MGLFNRCGANLFTAAMLFSVLPPGARAQSNPSGNQQMTIELDHKQDFGEPVKHVLLDKDAQGKPIPRIVVKKQGIEIMDAAGNRVRTIPREDDPAKKISTHFYQNEHGNNIAVHITRGYSKRRESWQTGEYYILDKNGNETLHIKNFNDDTKPIPSPSGDYAIGWPAYDTPGGPPIFYDANGYRNKWAHGFSGEGWPDQYVTERVAFSPDGTKVAVVAAKLAGFDPRMIVFDANGNRLWERFHPISRSLSPRDRFLASNMNAIFTPSGQRIVYWTNHVGISAADLTGNVIWTSSMSVIAKAFSQDEKFMLATDGPAIYMISMADGHAIWKWEGEWHDLKTINRSTGRLVGTMPDFSIMSMAVTPNFEHIAATGDTFRLDPLSIKQQHILVLGNQGRLLARKTLPGDPFATGSPVKISHDGGLIMVHGESGLLYFRVVQTGR